MIQNHKSIVTILLLASGISYASSESRFKLTNAACFVPHKLGKLDVYHQNGTFIIKQNDKEHIVPNYNVEQPVQNVNTQRLARFLAHGRLAIKQKSDGEFKVKANIHGKGGGVGGGVLGFCLGKAAVSLIGHGSIALISAGVGVFCPPAGAAVGIALEGVLGGPIETASMSVGYAVGVMGMVASGPA